MGRPREEPEGSGGGYNWMDTYGDLVTNLLCFFVLLYSFSSIDAQKQEELASAFAGRPTVAVQSMNVEMATQKEVVIDGITGFQQNQNEASQVEKKKQQEFDLLFRNIRLYIEDNDLESLLSALKQDNLIILRFREAILFNSGDATILDGAKPVLDHIISAIHTNLDIISIVRIEGHTDNVPIHTAQYKSNWQLSMARASSALDYCISSQMINMEKLSTGAYSEYQPVDTNETAEGRANNRRVDFVIVRVE